MINKYKIRRLAIVSANDNETIQKHPNKYFLFKNQIFEKLFDFCPETLFYDISLNSDISLQIEAEQLFIVLCISDGNIGRRNPLCRINILKICCMNDISFLSVTQDNDKDDCNKDMVSDHIFTLLKENHEKKNSVGFQDLEEKIKLYLKPQLRPYQIKAVRWLIEKEQTVEEISEYREISFVDNPSQKFYINPYNLNITTFIPKITLPCGGILADEMGLGKTIEMLGLILLHSKNQVTFDTDLLLKNELDLDDIPLSKIRKMESEVLCICVNKSTNKKKLIQCVECLVFQHIKCVRKHCKDTDPHICPRCWSKKTQLVPSRATVIVTPTTIKRQWFTEIKNHVIPTLKILMYEGVSSSWISPLEIADYDIILTDYNILKKELYFSSENKSSCTFRTAKIYMRTVSPLLKVLWYRVCLDEAQMVESSTSKASQMVKLLPAVHRWGVTGTPIQKSLEDLRGLLEFLDVNPIYEKNYWKALIDRFYKGNDEPLLNILGKIMWRTCKKYVTSELGIPEQFEKIHYIEFDDPEKLFYTNERQICAQTFHDKVNKLLSETGRSMAISKFDANTLKKILEPLKKLRQDCTVPVLLKFNNNQSLIKKLLQPQELLEHLKTSNELECKNQIRLMASNYNGLAGLHMIKEDYENAIKMYKSVIGLAKEFSGALSVDSLLQIHALHNMIIALELSKAINVEDITDDDDDRLLQEFINQKGELEWKYINTYYKAYTEALDCWTRTLNHLNKKFLNDGRNSIENGFISIFEEMSRVKIAELFLMKLQEEHTLFYCGIFNEYQRSVKTIECCIYNWVKSILSNRAILKNDFNKYVKIINLIRPKENLHEKVSDFVKKVFECHLKNIRGEDDEIDVENVKDTENKELCDLCKTQITLLKYECLIFDKHLDERKQASDGTWNPSMQENVLKLAIAVAKNKNVDISVITDLEKSLELVESIKKEYKELSKLWIEIEYIAKAYDELEMCKMRLTAVDEIFDDDDNKKASKNMIYEIPTYQIDDTFQDLQVKLNDSKIEFYRKLGRLKYIKHLQQNTEPEICPICKQRPKNKYCVLDCGHIICVLCLNEMSRYRKGSIFDCAICRNRINNVYFVSRKPADNEIVVKGDYSSKIKKIVSTILELKMQDSQVKIIIFSHWQTILKIISTALIENSIEHRLMWSTKSIEEFKNENLNVNCMLMLLSHGSKGLNLIESTHVFLVEPILNIGEELQAINRVHRIGQTRITTVHRFIVQNTIEEKIFNAMSKMKSLDYHKLTIENLSRFICEDE